MKKINIYFCWFKEHRYIRQDIIYSGAKYEWTCLRNNDSGYPKVHAPTWQHFHEVSLVMEHRKTLIKAFVLFLINTQIINAGVGIRQTMHLPERCFFQEEKGNKEDVYIWSEVTVRHIKRNNFRLGSQRRSGRNLSIPKHNFHLQQNKSSFSRQTWVRVAQQHRFRIPPCFHGNRTKEIVSQDSFEKHQWRHQVGELPKSGEISAVGLIYCWRTSSAFWLLEGRGLIN